MYMRTLQHEFVDRSACNNQMTMSSARAIFVIDVFVSLPTQQPFISQHFTQSPVLSFNSNDLQTIAPYTLVHANTASRLLHSWSAKLIDFAFGVKQMQCIAGKRRRSATVQYSPKESMLVLADENENS